MTKDRNEPTGRAIGGFARKAALTPEVRTAQAQHAAAARWGKPLIATHKGNFNAEFGVDVECYVLSDATRTAVISQRGMSKALGLSERGSTLPRFLNSKVMTEAVGAELIEKFRNPLKFQWGSGGAEQPPAEVHGYDATLLIDLCKAIISAYEQRKLGDRYSKVAQQASIILAASAKFGVKGLVWALAGFNPTADEVIEAFKAYVQEEARKYEQEFPSDLYVAWHRLYQIPVPLRGKPWHFKHLTIKHVWYPLAKSNGKILQLVRALKSNDGDRRKKLFQFLNDVGARALRIHIGRLLEMAESSESQAEYEKKVLARFGAQQELDLVMPDPVAIQPEALPQS